MGTIWLVGVLAFVYSQTGSQAVGVSIPLVTFDGRELSMNNFGERPLTAVIAMSARCPFTERAINELNRLQGTAKYRLRNVLFVGLFCNPDESANEIRAFCQERRVGFPTYRDRDQQTAKRLGYRAYPEALLFDQAGKIVFRTGVDSKQGTAALERAMVAMLNGRTIDDRGVEAAGTPLESRGQHRSAPLKRPAPSFTAQFIFDEIPDAPMHHCSTITQTAEGEFICVWYGGSYESADDQTLFLARRLRGEVRWSKPEVVIRDPVRPAGNAVVFCDGRNRLWIIWGRMESSRPIRPGGGWGNCRLLARRSEDGGRTWSADRALEPEYSALPRNSPIRLASGELIVPFSGNREAGAFFLGTNDDGETWRRSGSFHGGSQPTLIQRSDGSLLALLRNQGKIQQSESKDGGKTWSPPKSTLLSNPGSGIAMTKLRSGRVVLVFNDSAVARTPLSIVWSNDEGKSWLKPLHLESNPGEFSYPCIIQATDGTIHTTYTYQRRTIKHVAFNESWLEP